MRAKNRRLLIFSVSATLAIAAFALVAIALRQNANMFYTPSLLAENGLPEIGKRVKVGGYVAKNSIHYGDAAGMRFRIVDGSPNEISVSFEGIAPGLFRENEQVVAIGTFDEAGEFHAVQLLAKHDENYQVPELADIAPPEPNTTPVI